MLSTQDKLIEAQIEKIVSSRFHGYPVGHGDTAATAMEILTGFRQAVRTTLEAMFQNVPAVDAVVINQVDKLATQKLMILLYDTLVAEREKQEGKVQ